MMHEKRIKNAKNQTSQTHCFRTKYEPYTIKKDIYSLYFNL